MSKVYRFIKYAFDNHPVLSNSLIYGSLYVAAEFAQQTMTKKVLVEKPEPYNPANIGRLAIFGTAIGGPILTVWYTWLDKKFQGTAYKVIAKKLILDQFFCTPQLYMLFFISMSIMEHKENIFEECKQKMLPTFQTSCMFWLPAQSVNFLFIPPKFRVIYVGTCSFVWVNILCWIKRQTYDNNNGNDNNNDTIKKD